MKDTLIWCKTKKQLEDVVSKLSEDGYSVPESDHMWASYGEEITLRFNGEGKSVAYAPMEWYEKNGYGTPITAKEFLGNKVPNIVIFRRDRNVIAKDVATGNEGIAKCRPDDCFVFKIGACIALARLMAKTPDALNHDVKDEWIKVLDLTPVDDNTIRENDIVKVVNVGLSYTSYPQWVGEHISDPYMAARYCYGSPNTESKYKVIKLAEHENNGRMLAFIEECNGVRHSRCYLIEVKGLEKV